MSAAEQPAVATAAALGHDVEWDSPAAMTAARRWTCRTCGATVLDYRGNVYGSATTEHCFGNDRYNDNDDVTDDREGETE